MTAISAASGGSSALTRAPAHKPLGQADFIRLMTTQMKLQDPLEPVDNKEMIAQMAQFSSLAGIDQVNQTLEVIALQLNQVLAAQAAASPSPETPAA